MVWTRAVVSLIPCDAAALTTSAAGIPAGFDRTNSVVVLRFRPGLLGPLRCCLLLLVLFLVAISFRSAPTGLNTHFSQKWTVRGKIGHAPGRQPSRSSGVPSHLDPIEAASKLPGIFGFSRGEHRRTRLRLPAQDVAGPQGSTRPTVAGLAVTLEPRRRGHNPNARVVATAVRAHSGGDHRSLG